MHVCLLVTVLDAFRGGNHLPLLSMLRDCRVTILTNRVKPANLSLPAHVSVVTVPARLGPFYYGIADHLFARSVLRRYPPQHPFWKQFDLVHLNQTLGSSFLQLRNTGRPLLYLVHHPVSVDRELALAETQGISRLRWRLRYALPVAAQRRLVRGMPNVATVSCSVSERIAHDYGRAMKNIDVVPNGVDGSRFAPHPSFATDYDVVALGSFLHPRRGFPYLVDLYRRLASRGLRIADVGKRSLEQEKILRALPGLAVLGIVDDAKLLSTLQRSASLVSTSLYEGFGLSLVEALACGRPAFAFDGGAVREVLAPIDEQLVVPARDVDALERRLLTFLGLSEEEKMKKGMRYREEVLRRYPLEESARRLKDLYGRIASA